MLERTPTASPSLGCPLPRKGQSGQAPQKGDFPGGGQQEETPFKPFAGRSQGAAEARRGCPDAPLQLGALAASAPASPCGAPPRRLPNSPLKFAPAPARPWLGSARSPN